MQYGTDAGVHCHLDLLALCDVQQGQEGQRARVKRAQDPTIEQFSTIPTIEKSPSVWIIEAGCRVQSHLRLAWRVTPRNLIEDDGLIVMEPYDMGFGSNPFPINSVFERC